MAVSGFGTIFIQLDKGSYSPGEQINGTIFLNITNNYPGAQQIWISISGMEDTKLIEQKTRQESYTDNDGHRRTRTETYYVHHQDLNSFFNHKFPIYSFDTAFLPAGQYTFPISFSLQKSLPSTFNYDFYKHGPCHARVNYVINAQVKSQMGGNVAPIMSSQGFIVNQEIIVSSGLQKKQIEKEIKSCFCIAKGKTKIVTYFEKNDYTPGEIACMITEVDNSHSEADIHEIRGIFQQVLKVFARGYSEMIVLNHQTVTLRGIKAKQALLGEDAKRIQVALRTQSGSLVQPTCRGRLVCNEYNLSSKLKVDACICCDSDPSCEIVINVRNPDMHYEKWVDKPSNWNPQFFNTYNAQFTSEYSQNVFYPPQSQELGPGVIMPGFPRSPDTPMDARTGQIPYPGHHVHNGPFSFSNQPTMPLMPLPPGFQGGSPIAEGMPAQPTKQFGSKPVQPGLHNSVPIVTEMDFPKQPEDTTHVERK